MAFKNLLAIICLHVLIKCVAQATATFTKVVFQGGANPGDPQIPQNEIIDLNTTTPKCQFLEDYPLKHIAYHTSGYSTKYGLVNCGGQVISSSTGSPTNSCYSYNDKHQSWNEISNFITKCMKEGKNK